MAVWAMQRLPFVRRTPSSADCWKSISGLALLPSSPADAARSVPARPHFMAADIGPDVRSRLSWRSLRHCRTILRSRRDQAEGRLSGSQTPDWPRHLPGVGSGISRATGLGRSALPGHTDTCWLAGQAVMAGFWPDSIEQHRRTMRVHERHPCRPATKRPGCRQVPHNLRIRRLGVRVPPSAPRTMASCDLATAVTAAKSAANGAVMMPRTARRSRPLLPGGGRAAHVRRCSSSR
jgi:hypothetical protein